MRSPRASILLSFLSLSVVTAALSAAAAACGVEPPCPPAELSPPGQTPAWAVVTGDYESTAVALLDREGALITEAWLDSGTVEPGIAAALTGDVVLPTDPVGGELILLDRFGVDVVTRIAVPSGRVLGQLPTQLSREDSTSGFRANPHDVVFLEDGRVWASRYEPNTNASAPPLDGGNDVVVVDRSTGTLTDRIAMDRADVPSGGGTRWARPDRMTRVGDHVVVGLGRLSSHWEAAEGAVVVLDPSASPPALEVTVLEDLAACGLVRATPDGGSRVAVLCSGDPFAPGSLDAATLEQRRVRAGLAILEVAADGTARLEHVWRAADRPDGPVPTGSLVALGSTRVAFVAMGDPRVARPDRVFVVDLGSGSMRPVFESEPFAVGTGGYDTDTGVLFLPDATRGVRRVRVHGDLSTEEEPPVDPSPCRGLPAREMARLISP